MFFILSKLLGYLFHPIFWIIIALLAALIKRKWRKKSLILAFILAIFFSNSFFVTKIVSTWAITPRALKEHFDVGIVLGGSTVTYNKKYNRVVYRGEIDRLLQAVLLYKKGDIKKILITGGSANIIYKSVKEAHLLNNLLINLGIPHNDIFIDTLAQNTYQNAYYSKQILKKYPQFNKLLLITSELHMRRALGCFKREGLKVTPYPTNLINSNNPLNFEYLFIPNASNFLIWDGFTHEVIGYLTYKIVGYI